MYCKHLTKKIFNLRDYCAVEESRTKIEEDAQNIGDHKIIDEAVVEKSFKNTKIVAKHVQIVDKQNIGECLT